MQSVTSTTSVSQIDQEHGIKKIAQALESRRPGSALALRFSRDGCADGVGGSSYGDKDGDDGGIIMLMAIMNDPRLNSVLASSQ